SIPGCAACESRVCRLPESQETAALFSLTIVGQWSEGGLAEGRIGMFRKAFAGAALAAAALAAVVSTSADAQRDRVQVGSLECSLSSSVGLIVASQRNIACNF